MFDAFGAQTTNYLARAMLVLPVQSPAETFESTDKYPHYWMLVYVEKGTTTSFAHRSISYKDYGGKRTRCLARTERKRAVFSHVNKEKIVSFQRPINPCSLETALTFPVIRTLSKSEFVFRRFCGCASTCSCTYVCVCATEPKNGPVRFRNATLFVAKWI